MNDASVVLWGKMIGAVSWIDYTATGVFQYTPDAVKSGVELSPLAMPLRKAPYEFPFLARNQTFKGLPGLIADSLPDVFGNSIIDAWLQAEGRTNFNPVERLCTIGARGMGALEYEPTVLFDNPNEAEKIEVAKLVDLANKILQRKIKFNGSFDEKTALKDILRVGTSAGGARAKAILAWNQITNTFRTGQAKAPAGYEYWILKFDGVSDNQSTDMGSPLGYGLIEYAYSEMIRKAGIEMMPCKLFQENTRSHFMTKRFDRTDKGEKIHMQSLGALIQSDYLRGVVYSYEQTIQTMKKLNLPRIDFEQLILRAMFNVIGRNLDDHIKNITFMMNKDGEWRLSPAYDVSYTYNPVKDWTSHHQMRINGKTDDISQDDLIQLAGIAGIKPAKAKDMLHKVGAAIRLWPEIASEVGIPDLRIHQIHQNQLLSIIPW